MTGLVEKTYYQLSPKHVQNKKKIKPRQKSEKPPRIVNHHQEPSKKILPRTPSRNNLLSRKNLCQEETVVKIKK